MKVHGRFTNDHTVDPTTTTVGVRLINTADGATIYRATIPAGAVVVKRQTARSTVFYFKDRNASVTGGGLLFKVQKGPLWYRVTTEAYGDMSAANPNMTVEITFGVERYTSTGTWIQQGTSWYLLIK